MDKYGGLRIITRNTIIVGTGAAGLNAADRLWQLGQTDIAIVTEGINVGTSRNTGSDKQTYYKLTMAGSDPDSVGEMTRTLFEGQCMDGDIALCEAALSSQSFYKLVELGVPFPQNQYGEYVGYKTDHDPRTRATSVGPYTSREITVALEKAVRSKNIDIYDRMQVIRVLSDGRRIYGLICLDLDHQASPSMRFVAFCCQNIIFAPGGPAGMYADSVYPCGHHGATGIAFRAGAKGRNLTEWQYGLASIRPRWNVSGTYMQVIPRFISTDQDGGDEREFLYDFFQDQSELFTKVFLKGYQWPFDVRKVAEGSSIIDILVCLETAKGRRVWLDFRKNPGGGEIDFTKLSPEAFQYLSKANACFGTPIERLQHMNAPAVNFYREHGIDLTEERLEIALCAQHNNGGLAVDCWWQTNLQGLYCVGEAAGTHGVYRPGGSALNSGQVGSTRAAQHVSMYGIGVPDKDVFLKILDDSLNEVTEICDAVLQNDDTLCNQLDHVTRRMSVVGAAIRNRNGITQALEDIKMERIHFTEWVRISNAEMLCQVFRLEDTLLCQQTYLSAMLNYIDIGGKSRGSAIYTDPLGIRPFATLPDTFTYALDNGFLSTKIQEVIWQEGNISYEWRDVRPIPDTDDLFENVWRDYRKGR